jgi:hypothetical protein
MFVGRPFSGRGSPLEKRGRHLAHEGTDDGWSPAQGVDDGRRGVSGDHCLVSCSAIMAASTASF